MINRKFPTNYAIECGFGKEQYIQTDWAASLFSGQLQCWELEWGGELNGSCSWELDGCALRGIWVGCMWDGYSKKLYCLVMTIYLIATTKSLHNKGWVIECKVGAWNPNSDIRASSHFPTFWHSDLGLIRCSSFRQLWVIFQHYCKIWFWRSSFRARTQPSLDRFRQSKIF